MNYYAFAFSYLLIAFLPVAAGLFKYRQLDKAARIFWALVTFSFVGELSAVYAAVVYHDNMPVYNISSIIEMGIIAIYFNYIIESFRKRHLGFLIAALSVIIGVLTLKFATPPEQDNFYFMGYQGILVICMCMLYLVQLINKPPFMKLSNDPHYWFSLLLFFSSVITLLNWALYTYLFVRFKEYKDLLNRAIGYVAIITYLGFTLIFLFYSKMKRNAAR